MLSVLLVSFSALTPSLRAQETGAAAAERQEAEERYKRMTADIEDLKTTVQSLQQRLNEQRTEIRRLNEEIVRLGANKEVVTREDYKHLADKIREVDERRIADNEKLLEKVTAEFARLGKSLTTPQKPALPSPEPAKQRETKDPKPVSDKGYEYTIRDRDHPRVISQALAQKGVKVTVQQLIDANPTVDWTKLRIGQKIFIPVASSP